MPVHAMIDLETLHTTPGAAVLTVGGVKFDPFSDAEPHSEFYYKLDIDSQYRQVSDDTIAWWDGRIQKFKKKRSLKKGVLLWIPLLNRCPSGW